MPRDHYEVLGVQRNASDEDIKRAYRSLARKHHPDRNPGDKQAEAKFKEVQDAYEILSDKSKREQYDRFGFAGSQPGFGGGPGGGTFHWGGGPGGQQSIDPRQAEEMFRNIFGGMGGEAGPDLGDIFGQKPRGRSRRGQPRQPEAATSNVTIPFLAAALGGTVNLRLDDHELAVKIPAGVEEGKILRLQGQGPAGSDLHLRLHIEPHAYFRREGNNVILGVPISLPEAIVGGKIDVPTLDGTVLTVKVPPGTSTGAHLRVRGKGIPRDGGGDLFLEFKVMVPANVDDRSREIIAEFAKLNPQNPRSGPPWN